MLAEIIWFLLFLSFLVIGAWCVSEGGEILGEYYDASVVGGFVIAWLNTAPETIFFILALSSNNPEFAVGAMSGSTIVVSTVALGICMVSGAAARPSGHVILFHGVRVQSLILLASLFVLFLLLLFEFNLFIGIIGILEYCAFAIFTLFFKPSEVRPEDRLLPMNAASFASLEDAALGKNDMIGDEDEEGEASKHPAWKGWAFLALGGANIYIFSTPFIGSVIELGVVFNMKPMLLAFFLAPLASEAPEILESFTLSRKGRTQNINIAVSNLVGGTISKTTLLFGILSVYSIFAGYPFLHPSYTISLVMIILSAGCAGGIVYVNDQLTGYHGKLLLLVYLGCCLIQVYINHMYGAEGESPSEGHQHQNRHQVGRYDS